MIVYLGIIAIQVACVVHLVKTGRNPLWLTALIFLPMVGAIAYFIVEILPGLQGNRHVRTVRAKATAALDPERELRAARGARRAARSSYREVLVKAPDDRQQRAAEAEMYRWGADTLTRLRAKAGG